jgi:hypothetical protein
MTFLTCNKKKNYPRIEISICEKKCPLREECETYIQYSRGLAMAILKEWFE